MELRVAAVEALGRLKPPQVRELLERPDHRGQGEGTVQPPGRSRRAALPRLEDASRRLPELIVAANYPLGLRRAALRTFIQSSRGGGRRILEMAGAGTLPADLKTEATTALNNHPDRNIRNEAARVLPLPRTATGRRLPPIAELLGRPGEAEHGRNVFFRNGANPKASGALVSCGGCHRVQGQGQWVGPDLSTIGTKYGKDELLRSVLNPSEAVGFSFRTQSVALCDGRVLTGLAVEDGPDRLVLKTAEGQRVQIRPAEIEEARSRSTCR